MRRKPTIVRFHDQRCGDATPNSHTEGDVEDGATSGSCNFGDPQPEAESQQAAEAPAAAGTSRTAPSRAELQHLFDALAQGHGCLGVHEISQAAMELSGKYSLGLTPDDADRLMQFLQGYEDVHIGEDIHRDAFVQGLSGLSRVLAQLKERNLTASQMRTIVAAAFEHFDVNSDGMISQEELRAATTALGMQLSEQDVQILHAFIAPSSSAPLQKDSVPIWEKVASAFERLAGQTQKRYSVDSVGTLIARMSKTPEIPNTLELQFCWLQQHVCEVAEHWADALELVVSAAGMGVAATYAANCLDGTQALSTADWHGAEPFLTFLALGVMDFAKELDEIAMKEMTVDEALLYAVVFRDMGFSQVQFRQLLACKGCRWTVSEAGDVINKPDDSALSFIVRGSAKAQDSTCSTAGAMVRPGTVIGAARFMRGNSSGEPLDIVAQERMVCVSWDVDELRDLLAHDNELAMLMDKVLATGLANNLRIVKSVQETGWKRNLARAGARKAVGEPSLVEDPAGLDASSEEDEGLAMKKTDSGTRRSQNFLQEVRWLRMQLLRMRRHTNKSGWREQAKPIVDVALGWLGTASREMMSDVERRGVLRTWYGVKQVFDALKAPESFQDTVSQAFNFWHSLDGVLNVKNVLNDYAGASLLVYGAWHHLCSLSGGPSDDFDAQQFMTLVGVWGVRSMGRTFRKTVEDLPTEEAELYAKGGFEEAGFTAGEFRHLLHGGAATCEKLQPGEVRSAGLSGPKLKLLIEGTVRFCGNSHGPADTKLSAREFLGQHALGVQDPLLTCPRAQCRLEAVEEVTILVWDVTQLKAELARDSKLRMKMLRMVTLSMADRLLQDTMTIDNEMGVAPRAAVAA